MTPAMAHAALTTRLPPVVPDVVAAAAEGLAPRLRKKLDAAIELYAAAPAAAGDGTVRISCGEDATVTLTPGPSGTVAEADQATCTCLLAPRCLHRAAVLGACPVAGPDDSPDPTADGTNCSPGTVPVPAEAGTTGAGPAEPGTTGPVTSPGPTSAQVTAAAGLWSAGAAVLATGLPGAGAVPQAELLRAAHTARLAGLHRAEAAAVRLVRGLRSARAREETHRLAGQRQRNHGLRALPEAEVPAPLRDLVAALRELLLTAGLLAAADPDPGLIGTARRSYEPGGSLRVHGMCREPVISATGYGGVVTHVVADDGRWFSVADVKPGGPARARAAATAPVAIGSGGRNHAQLARGGLLIAGVTISPDGRLGSGRGVRASPVTGLPWSSEPLAALFARPLAEIVTERLWAPPGADPEQDGRVHEPVGCDLIIVGAAGDHLLARELRPVAGPSQDGSSTSPATAGLLIRLAPADRHPDLAHTANLRQLASRPGLRIRVLGRFDPDRAATLYPLAVGPVPDTEATLLLPPQWLDRADLGYDRLQGSHLPPRDACPSEEALAQIPPDPLADAPLWRVRRLIELAVAGGRRAVAEAARNGDLRRDEASLRRTGFHVAADLAVALTAEADRRTRDGFGRLSRADPDRYASAWLAGAVHLACTEHALLQASWNAHRDSGDGEIAQG